MLFSAPLFLYGFFSLFFLGYFLTPRPYKNHFALFGSLFFYAWGEPLFVLIAFLSALADYALGRKVARTRESDPRRSKMFLALGVGLNLGLLVYFKYTNFFLKTLCLLANPFHPVQFQPFHILLPLGVSFIVFEKITYLADLYRGAGQPAEKFLNYAAYIFLFPKLLAGPIVKYHDIEDQLENRPSSEKDIAWGLGRFIAGLAKKVIIADTMSRLAEKAFSIPLDQLEAGSAWIGIAAFTLQIFFDFSGYSDMAIGMARMMGFKLNENFDNPYLAESFTDFWRRWHISLSTWIRSYLYIPLGGNRGSRARTLFNLVLCFALCGLWHGAQWTFVVWGLYQGFFLISDKLFWLRASQNFPAPLKKALTLFLVAMGWVLFRSASLSDAGQYYLRLFGLTLPTVIGEPRVFIPQTSDYFLFAAGLCWIVAPAILEKNTVRPSEPSISISPKPFTALAFVFLLLLCMVQISGSSFNPFIYFRF